MMHQEPSLSGRYKRHLKYTRLDSRYAPSYISDDFTRDFVEAAPDGEGRRGEVLAESDARGTLEAGGPTERER